MRVAMNDLNNTNPNIISEEFLAKITAHRVSQFGRKKHSWPKDIKAEAVRIIESGIVARELSNATGLGRSLIVGWAQKAKEKKKALEKQGFPKFQELQVLKSKKQEELHVCIGAATIFGLTAEGAVKFLREAGILPR